MVGNKPPLTFLSYSREDSEFALKLAQDLRSAGLNIWMDQLNIQAGMRWDHRVEKALEDCHCLMILLSPDAIGSSNVLDELAYALDEEKRVVPVMHRACKIPLRLRRIHYVDFTGNYETGRAELVKTFKLKRVSRTSHAKKLTDDLDKPPLSEAKSAVASNRPPAQNLWGIMVKIIAATLSLDPNDVTAQANFVDDLGADSLDLVELIMNFEEEYNIEIPDDDVSNIVTVGDAYQYGLDRLS